MDNTIALLNKVLDLTATRQKVLAHNLANVNTPAFKRHDVRFKDALVSALKARNPEAFQKVQADLYEDGTAPARPDGNTVSTHRELGELSQNQLLYRVATRALNDKLKFLKKAVSGK
ncbi:MAG: flagellar basal body rod protein FlgB [Kiritimatiellae bacterium]|nr:flagellar basal body rod protein FlgB [Kiritimatiellia bacterium]